MKFRAFRSPGSGPKRVPFFLCSWMALTAAACGGEDDGNRGSGPTGDGGTMADPNQATGLAVLGGGTHLETAVAITEIGSAAAGLNRPRGLAWNPEAQDQLWVVNHADHSMVIFQNTGTASQTSGKKQGLGSEHFMSKPSSLAFGAAGTLATAHEEDQVTQPTTPWDFMGPTLFTTDLNVFDAGHASHLDMLHNSPNAAGIAWDRDNVYWVFDGQHESITRYDFGPDHGLGGQYHADGIVSRYVEGQVGYVPGVSAHMELDHATGLLYLADPGNNRIATLDTAAGTPGGPITPNYDGTQQFHMMDTNLTTVVDGAEVGLVRPSGLALDGDHIFVTDNGASRVVAFSRDGELVDWLPLEDSVEPGGLQGLAIGTDGSLYVTDAVGNRVLRIAPLAN